MTSLTSPPSTTAPYECLSPSKPAPARLRSAMATGPSLLWGPNVPSSPRTLRVNITLVRKGDGSKNFPDNANTQLILSTAVAGMNSIFTNLRRQSLPSETTYLPDSMIRFQLEGIHFLDNDAAWNFGAPMINVCSPYWYDNFGVNKRKEFNIFILGHNGGGCGPSPFYFNFRGSEAPGTDPNGNWAMIQILAHEMGHCLGLWHTYQPDPIPDTTTDLSVGWFPSNSTTTSNNVMSGNTDRNHFSLMGIQVMQGRVRSTASSLRIMRLAPPTPNGLVSDGADDLCAVEESGDLVHAFWTPAGAQGYPNRWNFETVPHPNVRLVPGSLVSTHAHTPGVFYGVSDFYEVVKTGLSGSGAMTVTPIGGPGVTPGSLVDGRANDLYAVDHSRKLVRIMVSSGASSVVTSPPINAGSLVTTEWAGTKRVFAVTEGWKLVWAASGSTAVTNTNVTVVPGSLVAAGPLGLFGVTPTGDLLQVDTTNLVATTHNLNATVPGGLHGGSLVWQSTTEELYGVTPAGQVVRLVVYGYANPTNLPASIEVTPGSLVDGLANHLFGVSPPGDIIRIYPSGTLTVPWMTDLMAQWGGEVVPGSLITSSTDGGRAYGINVNGQIVGTWDDAGTIRYAIVE
jgi:hypothetical protein